jgi:hypothetical protein
MTERKAYIREYMRRKRAASRTSTVPEVHPNGKSMDMDCYQFRAESFQGLCDFLKEHSKQREPIKLTVRLGWAGIEAKKDVF